MTPLLAEEADSQILEHRRQVDYDVKEYPVEVVVDKYGHNDEGEAEEGAEFFIPDYQRELICFE